MYHLFQLKNMLKEKNSIQELLTSPLKQKMSRGRNINLILGGSASLAVLKPTADGQQVAEIELEEVKVAIKAPFDSVEGDLDITVQFFSLVRCIYLI